MSLLNEGVTALSSGVQLAQDAGSMEQLAPWENGLLGMGVVLTALISIWLATALVGTFFVKSAKGKAPGKTEAAPQAPAAAAAPSAAAADDIPLVAIIAAASYALGGQVRNVIVHVPGKESATWISQGRQSIYASHAAKGPQSVSVIGAVKKP